MGPNVGIAVPMGDRSITGMVDVALGEEKGIKVMVGCDIGTSVGVEHPLSVRKIVKENTILNILVKSARIIPEGSIRTEYFL